MQEEKKFDPTYDFAGPINKTSTVLAKFILGKLSDNKEEMIVEDYQKLEPLAKAAFIEKSTDFSIEVMREIAHSDIDFPHATKCIDKIIQILESMKQYIDGSITQARHEYASRSLGVRSPDRGLYTEEAATVGFLLAKLEELRMTQGNNKYDYFNEPAPEQPAPGVVADTGPDAPEENTTGFHARTEENREEGDLSTGK